MKSIRHLALALITVSLVALISGTAFAVPTLQLFSENATYDPVTQSWIITENPFVLQILGADQPNQLSLIDDVTLFIAVPDSSGSITIQGISTSLESGAFGPLTFDDDDIINGEPPFAGQFPPHGIYPTFFISIPLEDLQVNDASDTIINSVDIAEGITPPGTDTGDIDLYQISYSGFSFLHMDLVGTTHYSGNKPSSQEFAPFSHDATAVPEPGTVMLLGGGLIGLALYRRWGAGK
jgi:hypothetical protein